MSDIDGMKGREIEFIPDRLIEEPVVFRGMTDTEVVSLTVVSILIWVPVSVLVLMPFEMALFGVGAGFGMAILTLLIAGGRLQSLKRRMPDGLHIVYLKKLLQEKTPLNFGYIDTSQRWDIQRARVVTKINTQEDDE